ncbi:MAG TPA: Gfo/Idh/MocA family oxidoreductase [Acidobacteriota bacterium]|nr:Gfo/Idh/MocA family oxidoreductase [Acidobacteriota bacterium]
MTRPKSSRREFLWMSAAGVTALASLRGRSAPLFQGPPVVCAVVGCGPQGRAIIESLSAWQEARVDAYCDLYPPYRRRVSRMLPEAAAYEDLNLMLQERPDIEAVFVATPTHLHRGPVEAALGAGKHVYCEAPMASTIEDARAIAQAAAASSSTFGVGLQYRASPLVEHTGNFLRARAVGSLVTEEGHDYQNTSWRRPVSDASFEEALNWRLDPRLSLGLEGEQGVHVFDHSLRFQGQFPSAVSGFGSLMKWHDGREMPDTVNIVLQYPNGLLSRFEASLANSFRRQYYLINGSEGSILMQPKRSWWFKEADARTLGWEVYATREKIGNEEGIVLRADATKLLQDGKIPSQADQSGGSLQEDPLHIAVGEFLTSLRGGKPFPATALEGFQSAVLAVKAHQAVASGERIEIDAAEFEL